MSNLVVENLRLKELLIVVNLNKPYFDEFILFVKSVGYQNIKELINEDNDEKLKTILNQYLNHEFTNCLYDGIGRPYDAQKSKWFFITWVLRDAPQQRLQPIVSQVKENTIIKRRLFVIFRILKYVAPLLPENEQWEWPAISEVMLQRLEGSRRALKGGLFEAIVRDKLKTLFNKHSLEITITPKEVKINDETYDVELIGTKNKILMPVKTRETMGGGHAHLFTRDIHKAISVANNHNFNCIPVVIAESWSGNLEELECDNFIYIQENPNQINRINPVLDAKLESLITVFKSIQ